MIVLVTLGCVVLMMLTLAMQDDEDDWGPW